MQILTWQNANDSKLECVIFLSYDLLLFASGEV